MGEEDLVSQLHCLQPCGLFSVGRFWIEDQSTASQLKQGPDLEDQGVDGIPRQEHHGDGLQEVQVPDRDCRRCWWEFYSTNWFSVCFSTNLFLINEIVWFPSVMCHIKKTKWKFRIYRCHPVYIWIADSSFFNHDRVSQIPELNMQLWTWRAWNFCKYLILKLLIFPKLSKSYWIQLLTFRKAFSNVNLLSFTLAPKFFWASF